MNGDKRSIIKEALKERIDTPISYRTLKENIGRYVSEVYEEVEQTTAIDYNDILLKKWAYKYRYNTFHDHLRIQYAVSRYEYVHNSELDVSSSNKNGRSLARSLAIGYTLVTPIAPDEFYDRNSIKDVYLDLEMRRT